MAIVKIVPPNPRAPSVMTPSDLRPNAKKAAEALGMAFDWEESTEGAKFWQSVYDRLNQIAQDGELR